MRKLTHTNVLHMKVEHRIYTDSESSDYLLSFSIPRENTQAPIDFYLYENGEAELFKKILLGAHDFPLGFVDGSDVLIPHRQFLTFRREFQRDEHVEIDGFYLAGLMERAKVAEHEPSEFNDKMLISRVYVKYGDMMRWMRKWNLTQNYIPVNMSVEAQLAYFSVVKEEKYGPVTAFFLRETMRRTMRRWHGRKNAVMNIHLDNNPTDERPPDFYYAVTDPVWKGRQSLHGNGGLIARKAQGRERDHPAVLARLNLTSFDDNDWYYSSHT